MKHIILGTAGHIDHGKSALVKALTGVDPDRLPEEKKRGITIELGYAPLRFGDDLLIGIIDVPGHEKFISTMVSGASGIDIVLFCIDSKEGIKPQTREHLEIIRLLGIKHCLVAMTKTDITDENRKKACRSEIKDLFRAKGFGDVPVVGVSAMSGEGLNELKESIRRIALATTSKRSTGDFRLAVDRVFTIKGHGTVVTGTSIRGTLRVGDRVTAYSGGGGSTEAIVRQIECFGEKAQTAQGGNRLGINLSGVELADIKRGDIISEPGRAIGAKIADAWIETLKDAGAGIRSNSRLRICFGTREEQVSVKVLFVNRKDIAPGSGGFVRLLFKEELFPEMGERFVLRNMTPPMTVGGGVFLDIEPKKTIFDRDEYVKQLESLRSGTTAIRLKTLLGLRRGSGVRIEKLSALFDKICEPDEFKSAVEALKTSGEIVLCGRSKALLAEEVYRGLALEIKDRVVQYAQRNPLSAGLKVEELKKNLGEFADPAIVGDISEMLVSKGEFLREGDTLKPAGSGEPMSDNDKRGMDKILKILKDAGPTPPVFKELSRETDIFGPKLKDYLKLLERKKDVVKVSEELYYHPRVIEEMRDKTIKAIMAKGSISVADFKDITATSRKYAIPLLEYFDRIKVTLRKADSSRTAGPSFKSD